MKTYIINDEINVTKISNRLYVIKDYISRIFLSKDDVKKLINRLSKLLEVDIWLALIQKYII